MDNPYIVAILVTIVGMAFIQAVSIMFITGGF